MTRKSFLTTAEFTILNNACIPITDAFDGPPYLVGSVTETADFRDVDLRVILTDEAFDALFYRQERLWSLMCMTISHHLKSVTGLPIDFQIQRMTEANEKYPSGYRNALGLDPHLYAGGGDATRFDDSPGSCSECGWVGVGDCPRGPGEHS